jgi:hypothetical protein
MNRLLRTGIILGLITVVEFGVYAHYNELFTANGQTAGSASGAQQTTLDTSKVTGVQLEAHNLICVSPEGTQVGWIDPNNKLHVVDTSTGSEIYSLQLNYKPVYLTFIASDNLFIGTEADNGATKDIRLSTINTDGEQPRLIKEFAGYSADSTLEKIAFSPYTNDVYILIGNANASVVYHFDTNGNMNPVDLGGRILYDIAVTSTTDKVFIQDFASGTKNVLAFNPSTGTNLIQLKAALLGIVQNTMYYGTMDDNGNITAVYTYKNSGPGQSLMTLPQPINPQNVYVSSSGQVIVMTPGGYQNLSTHKTTKVQATDKVLNVGNALCILSNNGTLKIVQ